MTGQERATKLRQAAELVREVRSSLNNRCVHCPLCNMDKYEAWPEHLVYEQLDAAVKKLHRMADSFEQQQAEVCHESRPVPG